MKSEKDLPLYQICICAKQRRNPSNKPLHLTNDICEELHVDLMDLIISAGYNGWKYTLTIIDSYSSYCWVEDLHEKRESEPAFRKFVSFMKNQTNQKVKRIRIDQDRKFGVRKLEFWQAEKSIKIEYTVAYFPEINGIVEKINGLIVIKARCLL